MIAALRGRLRARWLRWMTRRIPPAREIRLSQRNVFIFPSGAGIAFLALLLALLVTAINYENNLVFGLAFLLAGLFVVAILHTYANLAGLTLRALAVRPVFAGERARVGIALQASPVRCHDALSLRWIAGEEQQARVPKSAEREAQLFLPAARRGLLRPGRLHLQSVYPLGLVRAWSWLDLDVECMVWPRPGPLLPLGGTAGAGNEGQPLHDAGVEDFGGLRDYAPGDPLRRVAWKTLAKGQPLQTREFIAHAEREMLLRWEQSEGLGDDEARVAVLCAWVLELHRRGLPFALELPGYRLPAGAGDRQRECALTALALFGTPDWQQRERYA